MRGTNRIEKPTQNTGMNHQHTWQGKWPTHTQKNKRQTPAIHRIHLLQLASRSACKTCTKKQKTKRKLTQKNPEQDRRNVHNQIQTKCNKNKLNNNNNTPPQDKQPPTARPLPHRCQPTRHTKVFLVHPRVFYQPIRYSHFLKIKNQMFLIGRA